MRWFVADIRAPFAMHRPLRQLLSSRGASAEPYSAAISPRELSGSVRLADLLALMTVK